MQSSDLYGKVEEGNIAKKHMTPMMIENGEKIKEESFIEKFMFGGIIITTASIGEEYCKKYNKKQREHIKNKTYAHKSLCECRDEPIGLMFLTLDDFLGNINQDYNDMDRYELCSVIRANVRKLIEERMEWVIGYSKHVIRDYYNMNPAKLKYKLNFILDDGKYEIAKEGKKTEGGLLLNGFLEELEFYTYELAPRLKDRIGIICQVLGPNGLPCNKKWLQIDVGISVVGKRFLGERLGETCARQLNTIRGMLHPDVIKLAEINNRIYYGSIPNVCGYEGHEIYILEVLYPDQITMLDERPLDMSFCMCAERYAMIENIMCDDK